MEVREILVANTKTQKKSKISTAATTLSELKAAFDQAGIDYEGMTFTEGISKTRLIDDATQLPHDILYKGQPTNNLVILLTNTEKKIASGTMSRKEILEYIKAHNLKDEVEKRFGNNPTRVSSANLLSLIGEFLKEEAKPETPEDTEVEDQDFDDYDDEDDVEYCKPEEPAASSISVEDIIADCSHICDLKDSVFLHIAMLANDKSLTIEDLKELQGDLNMLITAMKKSHPAPKNAPISTSDGSITDDDVDDMLNSLI